MKHSESPTILAYDTGRIGPKKVEIYIRRDIGFGGWIRYTSDHLEGKLTWAEIFTAFTPRGSRIALNEFSNDQLLKIRELFRAVNTPMRAVSQNPLDNSQKSDR